MWIAKPLQSLREVELRQWIHACSWRKRRGHDVPLAQTLTWARAAALSCDVYVVFNPSENVGGVVLGTVGPEGTRFECVNGPLLDWESPDRAARQAATFAMAVSQVSGSFLSLSMRPRWLKGLLAQRTEGLPLEVSRVDRASTLWLDLSRPWEEGFSPRLRRTLRASDRALKSISWSRLEGEVAEDFVRCQSSELRAFGDSRGFFVPGDEWFSELLENFWISEAEGVSFHLARAHVAAEAGEVQGQLFVALYGSEAHYLFGWEKRSSGAKAAWSAQAIAQREAFAQCAALGVRTYDFNGYLDPSIEQGAYAEVARFKKQFGGQIRDYEIPEFLIT